MPTSQQRADYYQKAKVRKAARKKLLSFGTEKSENGVHPPREACEALRGNTNRGISEKRIKPETVKKPTIRIIGIVQTCPACHQPLHLSPWDGGSIANCRNYNCQLYRQPVDKFTK